MSVKLSKRLKAIAQQVDANRVLDIGCDHGKLVENLFENQAIEYAFVSDISEPSVFKAVKLLSENNRNFDYAVADGFCTEMINKNIQQCIISGMGGFEIIKILSNNPTSINSYILQPQGNTLELKNFLLKNNLTIVRDIIVKDKYIYYNVIKAKKLNGVQKVNKFNLRYANENFESKNMDFYLYLQYLQQKYKSILENLPIFKKQKIKKELKFVNMAIKKWEKLYGKDVTISKD